MSSINPQAVDNAVATIIHELQTLKPTPSSIFLLLDQAVQLAERAPGGLDGPAKKTVVISALKSLVGAAGLSADETKVLDDIIAVSVPVAIDVLASKLPHSGCCCL